jgi:hypothetical protein
MHSIDDIEVYDPNLRTMYKNGELVRWFEFFAEGDIVSNAGIGVVVDARIVEPPELHRSGIPSMERAWVQHKVYKFESNEFSWLPAFALELFSALPIREEEP